MAPHNPSFINILYNINFKSIDKLFAKFFGQITGFKRSKYGHLINKNRTSVKQILVIFYPPGLGDGTVKTIVLRNLKTHFPNADITVLCHPGVASLLELSKFIDHIITINDEWAGRKHRNNPAYRAKDEKFLYYRLKFIKKYYSKFDIILDLDSSAISSKLTFLFNSKLQIGYGHPHCYTHSLQDSRFARNGNLKIAEHYLRLIEAVGITVKFRKLSLDANGKLTHLTGAVKKRFSLPNKYIVINPYAVNPNREWPFLNWHKILQHLTERRHFVVLTGPVKRLKESEYTFGNSDTAKILNLVGKTSVVQLAAIVNGCDLLLSVDTGPVHLAAALDKQIVALYGAALPAWEPYSDNATIIRSTSSCMSCERSYCIYGTMNCMKEITCDQVLSALKTFF